MTKNGCKLTTLGEIAEFMNGGAWNQTEYSAEGVPVVRVSDIKDETVDLSDCKFLPRTSLAKYEKHLLKARDLVICTVGSHPTQPGSVVGRAAIIPETAQGALLNQNAVRLRSCSPDVDQGWLGYLGRSRKFHDYIISCARGSANQVRMAIGLLKEMPVEIPPLPVQRRIAGILSVYDGLIENNQRRIKILEEMARALYREWFVNFRFPGHEKVPLVDSPLGPIAKGWDVKKLKDICYLTMGQSPRSEFYNETGEGQPFHQGVTDFGERFPTDRLFCTVEGRVAEAGDILFSVRAPVGRLNIADKRIIIGRGLSALRHKDGHQAFLWEQLRDRFQEEDIIGNGAIFAAVTKNDMETILLICPPEPIVCSATNYFLPIHSQIAILSKQTKTLRRTYDLLLPKLISGEISLNDKPTVGRLISA